MYFDILSACISPLCCWISTRRIRAKGVRWKLTRLSERGGSLLCSACQGWPLGVSQLWRRSLYHIKGASKEPLQQHFGPAWKNRACFDWSATFYCHCSADQQLAPASAILPLWLFERRSHATYVRTLVHKHTHARRAGNANVRTRTLAWHALPRPCTEPTETSGHTEEIGKIGIGFDDGTSQIKNTSIRNELEGVRNMETHLFPYWIKRFTSSYVIKKLQSKFGITSNVPLRRV